MRSITKMIHYKICRALENYDKGNVNPKELYKTLNSVYNEWEYILRGE